jgi:hypothetical protein
MSFLSLESLLKRRYFLAQETSASHFVVAPVSSVGGGSVVQTAVFVIDLLTSRL